MKKYPSAPAFMLILLIVVCWAAQALAAAAVARISKEDLKGKLGAADLIIIDVRTDRDWDSSDLKIRGAVRENPGIVDFWAENYPKDKTIVLYCA